MTSHLCVEPGISKLKTMIPNMVLEPSDDLGTLARFVALPPKEKSGCTEWS